MLTYNIKKYNFKHEYPNKLNHKRENTELVFYTVLTEKVYMNALT